MAKRKNPTPKEWAFIKEYALDFNGTEAYIRAFGSTPRNNASRMATFYLKKDVVQEQLQIYIQEQLGPQEKTLIGNVKFWTDIRDGTIDRPFIYLEDLDPVIAEALQDSDKVKRHPAHKTTERIKASEMLGKYQQMFVERKEVKVEASVQIVDDLK